MSLVRARFGPRVLQHHRDVVLHSIGCHQDHRHSLGSEGLPLGCRTLCSGLCSGLLGSLSLFRLRVGRHHVSGIPAILIAWNLRTRLRQTCTLDFRGGQIGQNLDQPIQVHTEEQAGRNPLALDGQDSELFQPCARVLLLGARQASLFGPFLDGLVELAVAA